MVNYIYILKKQQQNENENKLWKYEKSNEMEFLVHTEKRQNKQKKTHQKNEQSSAR